MDEGETQSWPQRAWILALIGALGGLAIHLLVPNGAPGDYSTLRTAAATFIGVAALIFGHGWARGHIWRALILAAMGATIIALVFLWNGTPEHWSGGDGWRLVAALLSVVVLVPLFQTAWEGPAGRPERWSPSALVGWARRSLPYEAVHNQAWTNVLIAGISLIFAFAFWLMLNLIGQMFRLIDINWVSESIQKEVSALMIIGAGVGASTGLLRERRRIIGALQSVAMIVLRIAAPVLAVALVLFLLSLVFTGLAPLWSATRSTTPITLGAAILALLLINSVVGDGAEGESRSRVYRWAALALALVLVPLAMIAAMSTGLRVSQYGWTPERLWAATFIFMACLTAAAYAAAVISARARWAERLRGANLALAFAICLLGLILSTPLISFDAIAARDQVARLSEGRIAPDKFDWAALRFDFGEPGRAAAARLAKSANPGIRTAAIDAQKADDRYALTTQADAKQRARMLAARLKILPAQVDVPAGLLESFDRYIGDNDKASYLLLYKPGDRSAILVSSSCETCQPAAETRYLNAGGWQVRPQESLATDAQNQAARAAIVRGEIEVRPVQRRQLYVNGHPIGDDFQ